VIAIDLAVESDRWSAVGDANGLAQRAAEAAFAVATVAGADVEINVLLADDATLRDLNRSWRGRDKPTNVLSFPASPQPGLPGPRPLGDIALAFETVAGEAQAEGKALADHAVHLIVHGVLHLLGYDHETEAEAETMEALEVKALARLGIADPYREMAA
jgi:probable rRNA maturation factor